MKKRFLWATLLPLLTFGQTKDSIINPKHNWYFGTETGLNLIDSYTLGEKNNFIQYGVLGEYYLTKRWSITGRVKYFDTGASYSTNNKFLHFKGKVISIPINGKWEYNIKNNFKGYAKAGFTYTQEIESDYTSNYPTNFDKDFASLNVGFGFTYFLSNKTAFYIDFETYRFGGYKGHDGGWLFPASYYTTNNLINFGVKFNCN